MAEATRLTNRLTTPHGEALLRNCTNLWNSLTLASPRRGFGRIAWIGAPQALLSPADWMKRMLLLWLHQALKVRIASRLGRINLHCAFFATVFTDTDFGVHFFNTFCEELGLLSAPFTVTPY